MCILCLVLEVKLFLYGEAFSYRQKNHKFGFSSVLDMARMELIFYVAVHTVLYVRFLTKTILVTGQYFQLLNSACTMSTPSVFHFASHRSKFGVEKVKRGHS